MTTPKWPKDHESKHAAAARLGWARRRANGNAPAPAKSAPTAKPRAAKAPAKPRAKAEKTPALENEFAQVKRRFEMAHNPAWSAARQHMERRVVWRAAQGLNARAQDDTRGIADRMNDLQARELQASGARRAQLRSERYALGRDFAKSADRAKAIRKWTDAQDWRL